MSEYRTFRVRCATDGLRTATFRGQDHLVVPVVALVEGVLHAFNADSPELVLAEEFSRFPSGWNGEPVMMNHPQDEATGRMLSANSPEILEKGQIGTVFGTHVDGKKLRMLAYVDLSRVSAVGDKAQTLISKIQESGTVEVSVGAFVDTQHSEGIHNGKTYKRVWRNIVPDHLAFLESGTLGACNNDAGCGAGVSRAAIHVVTEEGFSVEEEVMPKPEENDVDEIQPRSLRERLKDLLSIRPSKPEENEADKMFWDYVSSNSVEPIAAAEEAPVAAACGCGGAKQVSAEGAEGGVKVHKNAERITALISNQNTPWGELDRSYLETVADERLAVLEEHAKTVEPKSAAAPEPTPDNTHQVRLEDLPSDWQNAIRSAAENEKRVRTNLVEKLVAAQDAFTKDDLNAMPVDQLQKIGKAVLRNTEPIDFSAAAGVTRSAVTSDDNFADDPPSFSFGS